MKAKPIVNSVLLAATVGLCTVAARADVVADWNDVAMHVLERARRLPLEQTRTLALVHVAMFDAVNAIERKYRPYRFDGPAADGASVDAAAATAARTVLLKLYPDQQDFVDIDYSNAIANLPDGAAKSAGVDVGERAAAALLASRADDVLDAANTYRPRTRPGVYVPTALPVGSGWSKVRPWTMTAASQFRPGPPPDLKSALWARDYNEIKTLGARTSAARTPAQTEVARFWIMTGAPAWNPMVRALTAASERDIVANARLYALASMAAMDALIAVFDAKYTYQFWRPITAIRNGDIDGNAATARDAGWLPLVDTPMHPEYPCAHCITAGAVGAVLAAEFGAGTRAPVSMTSATAPDVTHTWTRIDDWIHEVDNARVWGGIHYRHSTEVGEAQGRKIGAYAVAHFLQPLH